MTKPAVLELLVDLGNAVAEVVFDQAQQRDTRLDLDAHVRVFGVGVDQRAGRGGVLVVQGLDGVDMQPGFVGRAAQRFRQPLGQLDGAHVLHQQRRIARVLKEIGELRDALREPGAGAGGFDAGADAGPARDHAGHRQHADGFADGVAAGVELVAELVLGGQQRHDGVAARADVLRKRLKDALVTRAARVGVRRLRFRFAACLPCSARAGRALGRSGHGEGSLHCYMGFVRTITD
ncbi:hypothetical protein G6F57_019057 [Rhizopus arrhizus]|nr:hypothetical protein G6F57_019057 [Rhizopus arrhizus]